MVHCLGQGKTSKAPRWTLGALDNVNIDEDQ